MKLRTVSVVIAAGILLAGCTATDELKNYSGQAEVVSEQINGKVCFAKLKNKEGVQATVLMGYRSICGLISEGDSVRLENGEYKRD